jgi:hypothetical protein
MTVELSKAPETRLRLLHFVASLCDDLRLHAHTGKSFFFIAERAEIAALPDTLVMRIFYDITGD